MNRLDGCELTAHADAQARLLRPSDDVATALTELAAETRVEVASGPVTREVVLQEAIPAGHKFAVRALARGLRVRKYGEFIGRAQCDIPAGAAVHVHNLATSARHDPRHERAWGAPARVPDLLQALGDVRCSVGENPLFDVRTNRLYWIDVRDTPGIHALHLPGGAVRSWPMREDVGALALTSSDDRLLVALRSGFAYFDEASGRLTPIVDPEPETPQTRMNDGKVDAAGRFWCGSMNPDSGVAEGSLYVLDAAQNYRRVLGDWLTPNGIAWSLDQKTMYVADTRRGEIYAFPFDVATGELGARRVFADLGAFPGGPDGAAVDCEGFLWSAQFDGGCLMRYAPDGTLERVIRLPVSKPTSCAFGGAGHRQLFVTTASRGLGPDALRGEPLAGRMLVLDVGVGGLPPQHFDRAAGGPP